MIDLANSLNIRVMVFGSPRNRQKGNLSTKEALDIARPFFKTLGDYALSKNTSICIEANARHYGCDFINTTDEAYDLVQGVDSDGFGLHLDLGNMLLEKENPQLQIEKLGPHAKHFHISSPELKPINSLVNIAEYVRLTENYSFSRSIEMLLDFEDMQSGITQLESCLKAVRS
jgi:sugar phosphate isomerase/epimerase